MLGKVGNRLEFSFHQFKTSKSSRLSLASSREELEKQKAHERYMRLQEQGKTQQVSYISLHVEHLALICQQRAEAAKKNEKKNATMIPGPSD
ncbi:hypothetical protein JHK85_000215 [Glycine max]|nr:hypothetical protein JHK85_000215 [Glycine max]